MNSKATARLADTIAWAGSIGAMAATIHTVVNLRKLRRPVSDPPAVGPRVSVLIPARNEAASIGQCLQSVRDQADVPHLEILVLDDQSSDSTGQVIKHHLADPRVRLVPSGGEPPSGWLGKTWACHQLSEHATGTVLVFLDADVGLEPHAIAATLGFLAEFDAVSPYPNQISVTASERLVQPLLQWSWLTFLPLTAAERSSRPSLVAANGQFLVISRDAYDDVGGHATVRHEVVEDVALFRALKRIGRRGLIADGTNIARCHMYQNWQELQGGYEKSMWSAFGSRQGALAATALLNLLYVVPAVAMLRGSRIGTLGYSAGVLGRALVARRVSGRVWPDSAAHPASITLFTYLMLRSLRKHQRGDLEWKGRPISQP